MVGEMEREGNGGRDGEGEKWWER
jgi:hypothetical protein